MFELSILLVATILMLYGLRYHKLIVLLVTASISLILAIAVSVKGFSGTNWFGVIKSISVIVPMFLYVCSSWSQQSSLSSQNWLNIFAWILFFNALEAAVYAFEILPHTFFIYSSCFFILISALTVPKSKHWFYDDTFQCPAFSDLAWVFLYTSSLTVLYFHFSTAFLVLLFLSFPLFAMVFTRKSHVWAPVRAGSLYCYVIFVSYKHFMRAHDPYLFNSVSGYLHNLTTLHYSGLVFFYVNCFCLCYLIYSRWVHNRYSMNDLLQRLKLLKAS